MAQHASTCYKVTPIVCNSQNVNKTKRNLEEKRQFNGTAYFENGTVVGIPDLLFI